MRFMIVTCIKEKHNTQRQNTDWRKVSQATGGKRIFSNLFNAISCVSEKKFFEDTKKMRKAVNDLTFMSKTVFTWAACCEPEPMSSASLWPSHWKIRNSSRKRCLWDLKFKKLLIFVNIIPSCTQKVPPSNLMFGSIKQHWTCAAKPVARKRMEIMWPNLKMPHTRYARIAVALPSQ